MVNTKTKFPRGIWIRSLAKKSGSSACWRAPGPGLKLQATSIKRQAPGCKLSNQPQASSAKRQASQPE